MRRRLSLAAILAGLVLSGCSTMTPLMQNQSGVLPDSHLLGPSTISCTNFAVSGSSGAYSFGGPCTTKTLSGRGATFALNPYKGLSLKVALGQNNLNSGSFSTQVAVGDAIGTGDIAGKIDGTTFPLYGSTKCTTPEGRATPCAGKAFIYFALKNQGLQPGFNMSPKITVVNDGPYPGTKACTVVYMNPRPGHFGYYILPLHAAPSGHRLVINQAPAIPSKFFPIGFKSGSSFFYAIACK